MRGVLTLGQNIQITLVVLAEIIPGVAIPGRPYANMIFKIYGWIGVSSQSRLLPIAITLLTWQQLWCKRCCTFRIRSSPTTFMFRLERPSAHKCSVACWAVWLVSASSTGRWRRSRIFAFRDKRTS